MTELEEYYNKFNEEKRLNSRHGRVEFITSMKYIHDCLGNLMNEKQRDLRSQIKILDVGAGTGRYSVPLAEEGYDVTALELVKHNLGRLKQKSDKVKRHTRAMPQSLKSLETMNLTSHLYSDLCII